MLRVPNPTGFKGIVIAKRRADAPATEEPIVYAYAKLAHRRRPVVATEVVLGLAEDKDRARMPPPSNIETRYINNLRFHTTVQHPPESCLQDQLKSRLDVTIKCVRFRIGVWCTLPSHTQSRSCVSDSKT